MKKYRMTIEPALAPAERHRIQAVLAIFGYRVLGGGTATDMSSCDISFYGEGGEEVKPKAKPKPKWQEMKKLPKVTKKPKKKGK